MEVLFGTYDTNSELAVLGRSLLVCLGDKLLEVRPGVTCTFIFYLGCS